jgi:hypothetical protein
MNIRHRGRVRQQKDDFWTENTNTWLYYGLLALYRSREPITLDNLNSLIISAPMPDGQGGIMYRRGSFCEEVLQSVQRRGGEPGILHFFENKWLHPDAAKQSARMEGNVHTDLAKLRSSALPEDIGKVLHEENVRAYNTRYLKGVALAYRHDHGVEKDAGLYNNTSDIF